MFLEEEDMGSTLYGYQIEQITGGDDTILLTAMAAAEDEVRSYLTGNWKREWGDGRLQYNVDKILSAEGDDRNALILKHCVVIAKWWLVDLSNADIIMEQATARYDRSVDWLKQLSRGDINLGNLPVLEPDEIDPDRKPFSFGSRKKFNHEIN